MSATRTAASPRARRRTTPTTVGWIAIIAFVFLASLGAIAAIASIGFYVVADTGSRAAGEADHLRPAPGNDHLRPDRQDRAGPLRRCEARDRDLRRDPQGASRRDHRRRGQDLLGQRRLRPGGDRLRGARFAPGQQPRRVDHHPAAGPPAPPRPRPRPGPAPDRRAQAQGDHPVDPGDAALQRSDGQAGHHHRLPQPELLRQPELRREGGGPWLLRDRHLQDRPGAGGDHRRAAQVAVELRPRPQLAGAVHDRGRQ